MFQTLATDAGSKIWILDLMPANSNSIEPNGRRWQPGDPAPIRVLMDMELGSMPARAIRCAIGPS